MFVQIQPSRLVGPTEMLGVGKQYGNKSNPLRIVLVCVKFSILLWENFYITLTEYDN